MSLHDHSSIIPPTPSSARSTSCVSPVISQPIDLDNGPSASSPHPTSEKLSYPSGEDISDLDDPEPEDDLSPILDALIVNSIKIPLIPSLI